MALAMLVVLGCPEAGWSETATADPKLGRMPGFVDVTESAGLRYRHRASAPADPQSAEEIARLQYATMAGGVAAGDYDGDGWVDLYITGGNAAPDLLFRNRGDGTFEEIGEVVGRVAGPGAAALGSGPTFADYDGDGRLDLFVGGVAGAPARLLRNLGQGRFEDVTARSGLTLDRNTFSAAFGDFDRDGDLDLALAHWHLVVSAPGAQHLWRNNGDGTFSDVSAPAGIAGAYEGAFDVYSFAPVFADVDDDGWPDLLMVGDFGTTRVFRNRADGRFEDVTDPTVITDENGMGVAVGDFDNDGDLDWFVTSVFHRGIKGAEDARYKFGASGNRLYRNEGGGRFSDATESAGVRDGAWGWAACFADFDNDARLDIFHVNGMGDPQAEWWREEMPWFLHDRARLFLADDQGGFTERAESLGVADPGQGRGVVCFDYDRDGDIDIFIANNGQAPRLYRNELRGLGRAGGNYLAVRLAGDGENSEAVGARILIAAGGVTQMRELHAGSNFASQNPTEAHFGLGPAGRIDVLCIQWPGPVPMTTVLRGLAANQRLLIEHPAWHRPSLGEAGGAACRALVGAAARHAAPPP